MGIRTLHRHMAPAQANTDATPSPARRPVPPFAADASTARIPGDLGTALRGAVTGLRSRRPDRAAVEARLRLWAEQARGYLALVLGTLPRSRPPRTVTIFTATLAPVTARHPDGSAPERRASEPGATP